MNENILKKSISNFDLIGRAKVNQFTYQIDNKSDSGYIFNRLNLATDCGNGNVVYSELMGGYNPEQNYPIYVHGKTTENGQDKDDYKNQFQVAWEDRNDSSILKLVGDDCFIKVSLETDEKNKLVTERFLSAYDAIDYLKNNLLDGDIIEVRGKFEHGIYNEDTTCRKKITSIYLKGKDTDPATFKAEFTQAFLLNPSSLDKKKTENGTYKVFGYVVDYINKYQNTTIKQNALFPKEFEIEVDRYTQTQLDLQIKNFFSGKKGWFSELVVVGKILEGATTVLVDTKDFPPEMALLVACNVITEEEAIKKLAVTGERDKRFIWEKPLVTRKVGEEGEAVDVKVYNTIEKYKDNEVVFVKDLIGDIEPNTTQSGSKGYSKPPVAKPTTTTTASIDIATAEEQEEVDLMAMFGL